MIKVNIMMSTYNGEKYLSDQLKSLSNQEGVSIKLYIRDDGSTDRTTEIIQKYMDIIDIDLIKGSNIGWKKSFLKLVNYVPVKKNEYYAFCDQDDVWLEKKLINAVCLLDESSSSLYASNLIVSDSKLNIITKSNYIRDNYSRRKSIFNGYGMGCTIVYDSKLHELLIGKQTSDNVSHDVWISVVGNYFFKSVFDNNSYILYRQHNSNASWDRINIFYKMYNLFFKNKDYMFKNIALDLRNNYKELLNNKEVKYLNRIIKCNLISNKVYLLFNYNVSRDSKMATLKLKINLLLMNKRG